jgi:2-polyprenyl-3-methyl-5-hydroxy-6-metoxy-1,4-benzoquinol methylase
MYKQSLKEFLPIDLDTMRKPGFIQMMLDQRETQIKRVESKRGFRPQEECPLCGNGESLRFATINEWLTIEYCESCDFGYSSHFPHFVEDVYDSEQYLDASIKAYDATREYRKQRFGGERVKIIQRFHQEGRLLDVGCGTGWCLEAAREAGFEVVGQELSPQLATFTSDSFGIPVHSCPLSEISETFDVITMFDLIEHVPDPIELLEDCKKILNPGGIVLAFTPNLDSQGISEMKEFSSLVIPPSHLHYFTPKSTLKLASKIGMELVFCETRGMDVADLASFHEFKGQPEAGAVLRERFDSLQACIDAAGCANHMRFVLKLPA